MPRELAISKFKGKFDKVPKAKLASWEQLVTILSTHRITANKDDWLWSPCSYPDAGTRGLEDAIEVCCFVLDVDGGYDPADFIAHWESLGLAVVVHSSHSSTAAHPKWRAIFPLVAPVAAADWPAVWRKLDGALGLELGDPACKDASRMYYLPTCPPETAGEIFAHVLEGKPLDPSKFSDIPESVTVEPERAKLNGSARPGDDFDSRATWDDILVPAGWKRVRSYGPMTLWRRPGKKDGWSARTGPGRAGDRFFCWTSSTTVPSGKLLTKFGLLAHLEHGGDYGACAKALARKGYGDRGGPPDNGYSGGSASVKESPKHYRMTDQGNAERLVDAFGKDLLWVAAWGKFAAWDGKVWRSDETGGALVYRKAVEVIRSIYAEAKGHKEEAKRKETAAWAMKSEARPRLEAMVSLARHMVPAVPDEFDQDDWLMSCRNGTLDLRTGSLGPHRREDRITHLAEASFDPDAECPRTQEFLKQIFLGRDKMIHATLQAIGYALTGSTREHKFWIWIGDGRNGKSVLLKLTQAAMGTYAAPIAAKALLGDNGATYAIEALRGVRMAYATEPDRRKRLDADLIKSLVAGDPMMVEAKYGRPYTMVPKLKLFVAANHKPAADFDRAFKERLIAVPFEFKADEAGVLDESLYEKLLAEIDGFFSLLVMGCTAWQTDRMLRTDEMVELTNEYEEENDDVQRFIDEQCIVNNADTVEFKYLYAGWKEWAEINKAFVLSSTKFGNVLSTKGFEPTKIGKDRARGRQGLRLRGSMDL